MDFRRYPGKHVDGCLDILYLVLEYEIIISGQRSCVESGDVNGFRTYFRIGNNTVGTLLDAGPQSAFKKGGCRLLSSDSLGLGKIELGVFRLRVSLYSDFEKFSLLSSDNFCYSAAYRRGEFHLRSLFVHEKRRACLYGISFLDCELRDKAFEIGRFDSDCLRNYTLEDLGRRYTLDRYIEPLFQFYIVNHNLLYKVNLAANIDKTFVDLR